MRPLPAQRLPFAHGLLRAIDQRGRLRPEELVTDFSEAELFPPQAEPDTGRTRQYLSLLRAAGPDPGGPGRARADRLRHAATCGPAIPATPFTVSPGQAEWLRRALRESHLTDSIWHGAAIGLSLCSTLAEGERVGAADFGRAAAHLGRTGWDNENTFRMQGERFTFLLRRHGADRPGPAPDGRPARQLEEELRLPVHTAAASRSRGQLHPGRARGGGPAPPPRRARRPRRRQPTSAAGRPRRRASRAASRPPSRRRPAAPHGGDADPPRRRSTPTRRPPPPPPPPAPPTPAAAAAAAPDGRPRRRDAGPARRRRRPRSRRPSCRAAGPPRPRRRRTRRRPPPPADLAPPPGARPAPPPPRRPSPARRPPARRRRRRRRRPRPTRPRTPVDVAAPPPAHPRRRPPPPPAAPSPHRRPRRPAAPHAGLHRPAPGGPRGLARGGGDQGGHDRRARLPRPRRRPRRRRAPRPRASTTASTPPRSPRSPPAATSSSPAGRGRARRRSRWRSPRPPQQQGRSAGPPLVATADARLSAARDARPPHRRRLRARPRPAGDRATAGGCVLDELDRARLDRALGRVSTLLAAGRWPARRRRAEPPTMARDRHDGRPVRRRARRARRCAGGSSSSRSRCWSGPSSSGWSTAGRPATTAAAAVGRRLIAINDVVELGPGLYQDAIAYVRARRALAPGRRDLTSRSRRSPASCSRSSRAWGRRSPPARSRPPAGLGRRPQRTLKVKTLVLVFLYGASASSTA